MKRQIRDVGSLPSYLVLFREALELPFLVAEEILRRIALQGLRGQDMGLLWLLGSLLVVVLGKGNRW